MLEPNQYEAAINTLQAYKLPIFYDPKWIEIVSQGRPWKVAVDTDKGGSITGIWPIIIYRKWFLDLVLNPIFTPYFGPLLFYPDNIQKQESVLTFEKKTISNLIDQLPHKSHVVKLKLAPALTNWLPFYWKGFIQSTNYTYRIDLQSDEDIFTNYTNSLRADIKRVGSNISIESGDDIALVYHLMKQSFEKQDAALTFDANILFNLDSFLLQKSQRDIWVAKDELKNSIACVWVVYDRHIAYLHIIGRAQLPLGSEGLVKALIHHSITQAKLRGCSIFDFEGSMFPQFEKVFRAYGSIQTPYHVITKCKHRMLSSFLHYR